MKLLFCPDCYDVKGLVVHEWRTCYCKNSGGQYNSDGMTATLGGRARVFGVGNPFFDYLYPFLNDEGRKKVRNTFYGHDFDAWWGEYAGDVQIFRVVRSLGPRLSVKVRPYSQTENVITITDKRDHWVDGVHNVIEVKVPRNIMKEDRTTRWWKKKGKVKK